MEKEQEKQLVKAALKNPEAYGRLFDEYYSQIFRYALKRVAHLQSAQDITAEVFFKAYNSLWRYKWQGRPFSAWLYKIATNEINDYFKKGKKAPIPTAFIEELENLAITTETPEAEFILAQDILGRKEDILNLHSKVEKLPFKYQEVIALRYFEEKSILEICEILGKKEGTVKSLISRGIDLLEKYMQPISTPSVIYTGEKFEKRY